jgi:hypothetical protein
MPCYDPGAGSAHRAELQKQVNDLTRWLCSILGTLEYSDSCFVIRDKELADWWETHKAWDKARKEAQQ